MRTPRRHVGVVVPIYRVEEYLGECLASLAAQNFRDWTAYLAIDGSDDGSLSIARRHAAADPRFQVLSLPHRGLGAARNAALARLREPYVFFLDSDDVLPATALSRLLATLHQASADVVCGVGRDFFDDGRERCYWTQAGALYAHARSELSVDTDPELLDDHVVWNKLYSTALVRSIGPAFPPAAYCEDLTFSAKAMMAARRVAVIPDVVYRHRRRAGAISTDWMAAKPLGDWLAQGADALRVVAERGSRQVTDHYVRSFVLRQWRGRMTALSRAEPELLPAFSSFADSIARSHGAARLLESAPEVLAALAICGDENAIRALAAVTPSPFRGYRRNDRDFNRRTIAAFACLVRAMTAHGLALAWDVGDLLVDGLVSAPIRRGLLASDDVAVMADELGAIVDDGVDGFLDLSRRIPANVTTSGRDRVMAWLSDEGVSGPRGAKPGRA